MGDKCAWFHVFCAAVYGGMALWVQYEYFFNPGTVFTGWLSVGIMMIAGIGMFIPAFLYGLIGTILNANSISIPEGVLELAADSIFITLVLALTYCAGSSLLGVTPDKLPLISESIKNRMPTVDMFTVDSDGNLQLKEQEEEDKN